MSRRTTTIIADIGSPRDFTFPEPNAGENIRKMRRNIARVHCFEEQSFGKFGLEERCDDLFIDAAVQDQRRDCVARFKNPMLHCARNEHISGIDHRRRWRS